MSKSKRKSIKNQQLSSATFSSWQLPSLIQFTRKTNSKTTKRPLRADGFSPLPSVLRPRLVGVLVFSLVFSFFFQNFYVSKVSAASLTLTIPSTSLSLDISPLKESNFQKSSVSNISVKTDSESGYTLSIKSKNSENFDKLINSSGSGNSGNSNNMLNSISSALSETDYQNTGALNTWAWLPSKLNGENNTNFLPGPKNSEETILDITEDGSAAVTTYSITLATKIDQTIAPGNYTNTFVITSVANPPRIPDTMQEFTKEHCGLLDMDETVTLTDNRDNSQYTVAKLKDGKCWMTQNLRLVNKTLTPEDSDVTSQFVLPNTSNSYSFNSYNQSYVQYVNQDYGTYYSWYAATAGQGTGIKNDQEDTRIIGTSICPKGWHLPALEESTALVSYYDYATIQQPPANFSLAGANRANVISDQEVKGMFWQANAYNNQNGHLMVLNNSTQSLNPNSFGDKAYGFSVRCVADTGLGVTITYHLNSGSGEQTNSSTKDPVDSKISLDTSTRSGYGLVGWCDQYTTGSDCPGKLVRPGETYEVGEQTSLDFYAVWKRISDVVNKGSLGTMQDFNCDTSLPEINDYGTATDSRDNTEYKIARLIDNKCWMIDNLKIVGRSISSTDSDMTSGSFSIPASNLTTFKTSSSTVNNSAAYVDSYGGLYTWYTAAAGTGSSSITSGGVNATSSICPKGWKLPSSGSYSSGDFADLVNAYGGDNSTGSTNLRATPVPGFTYAGCVNYYDGSLYNQGSSGYYWSSTSGGSTSAYRLYLYSSGANPASNDYRVYGFSVRCLAR